MRTMLLVVVLCGMPALAAAEIESARYLEDGSVEIMDSGQARIVSNDPANRHRRALDAWVGAGHVITPYVPTLAELETAIRQESDRRVAAVYDRKTKDQMLARSNVLLLNRITHGAFTPEEQDEHR